MPQKVFIDTPGRMKLLNPKSNNKNKISEEEKTEEAERW